MLVGRGRSPCYKTISLFYVNYLAKEKRWNFSKFMTPDDKSGGVYGAASYVQRILQKIVKPLIFTVDEGGDTSPGVPVQAAAPSAQVARELECPVVAPIFSVIDPLSSVLAEPFWEESYDSNAVP